MAKVIVAGDAVVVTSALKYEEIKTLEKYRGKALVLMGGEEGKDEVFRIGTAKPGKAGSINKYGATFNAANGEGFATLTMSDLGHPGSEDVKEWLADLIGEAIINLNALEETIPAALQQVADQKAKVLEGIAVLA